MITTQHPIQIGNVTAEELAISLSIATRCTAAGVQASAVVTGQRFIRDGEATIPVGLAVRKDAPDVYALAGSNPAIAVEIQAITEALGRLAPLLDL